MTGKDDFQLNIPRRTRARRASGTGSPPGRRRTVDIDENDEYRALTIKLSERLHRRLALAVAAEDTTKLNLVIEAIEPVIDRILKEHEIEG